MRPGDGGAGSEGKGTGAATGTAAGAGATGGGFGGGGGSGAGACGETGGRSAADWDTARAGAIAGARDGAGASSPAVAVSATSLGALDRTGRAGETASRRSGDSATAPSRPTPNPGAKPNWGARNGYDMCRNELSRYNADNAIDCLRFPQMNGNEQTVAALSAGDLDWLGDGLTDPDVTFLPQSEFNNYWLPAGSDVNLQLNTTKAPFNNLEFRKAMSVAIDRQTLLDISTFGLTTATKFPIGTGEMYNTWYDAAALEPYTWLMEYNPDKAKEMLDAAGFVDKDGDGWRDNPDGTPIAFGISMPSGWTDWVNSGQTVAENLQDIGVNASLKTMDQGAWFDAVPRGDFDVYVMWTNGGPTPYNQYRPMFNPRLMVPGQIDFQSMHQMQIPAHRGGPRSSRARPTWPSRRLRSPTIHKLVAENVPVVSLFANPIWYEYSTRRFTGWVTEENPFVPSAGA